MTQQSAPHFIKKQAEPRSVGLSPLQPLPPLGSWPIVRLSNLMQNDWKSQSVGRKTFGLYRQVGFGLLRALNGVDTGGDGRGMRPLSQARPIQCAVIEAGLGAVGGDPTPEPPEEPPAPPAQPGPCAGTIELPGLRFALGQSVIRLESFDILDRALERLANCVDEHVQVVGHTIRRGPTPSISNSRVTAPRRYGRTSSRPGSMKSA